MSKKNDFQVGLFVISGLILAIIFTLHLGGGQTVFSKNRTFVTYLKHSQGLTPGAKVTLNGVVVGGISQILLDKSKRNIKIKFFVQNFAEEMVTEGARIEIATQGVLGDRYINIIPSSNLESMSALPNNAELPADSEEEIQNVLTKGSDLISTLQSISKTLDTILKNFDKNNRSDTFFKHITESAKNIAELTAATTKKIDTIPAHTTFQLLNQILEKVNSGKGTIGLLINDPQLYDQLKDIVGGINRNRIVRNFLRESLASEQKAQKESSP